MHPGFGTPNLVSFTGAPALAPQLDCLGLDAIAQILDVTFQTLSYKYGAKTLIIISGTIILKFWRRSRNLLALAPPI